MNYIYDVLSNFQLNYYDFFDWNKDDDILRIRKIPIIRIDNVTYTDFKYNKIKITDDFLTKIENRTEVFADKGIDTINYSAIFTNGKESMIIKFDSKGYNLYKSSMIIDEEREVLEDVETDRLFEISYEVIMKNSINFTTRNESKIITKIIKDINNLYDNKEYDKLTYLYFECFDDKDNNYLDIKDKLINNLNNDKVINKIYNFMKLISKV